jgi:hypothetical protein
MLFLDPLRNGFIGEMVMRNFAIAAMLSLVLVPSAVSAQVRCSDKVGFSTYPTGHFLPSPSGRPLDMY